MDYRPAEWWVSACSCWLSRPRCLQFRRPPLRRAEPKVTKSIRGSRTGCDSSRSYIVVLKDSVDHPGAVAESETDAIAVAWFRLSPCSGGLFREALRRRGEAIRQNPNVKYVSPVHKYEATAQTTPAGVKRIGAATNPALDIDGTDDVRVDADVAVIDTGIDFTHPDLDVAGERTAFRQRKRKRMERRTVHRQCRHRRGWARPQFAGTVGAIDNGIGVVGGGPGSHSGRSGSSTT